VLLLAAVLLTVQAESGTAAPLPAGAKEGNQPAATALLRSLHWLEAHPVDPRTDKLGWVTLDTWAWYVYAAWHPDTAVRAKAAEQVDRRLTALREPSEWTVVTLSQWATLMQIASLRGMPMDAHRRGVIGVDLQAIIDSSNPTTGWWSAELLRNAGFSVSSDSSSLFITTESAKGAEKYVPTVRDAYRVFHELVPASRLATTELTQLTPEQLAFVRQVVPGLIRVSREDGNTDAVAEALVSAALVGGRDTAAYRESLTWLLQQARADGTYYSARDAARPLNNDSFRHVVLVASLALLTASDPPSQP